MLYSANNATVKVKKIIILNPRLPSIIMSRIIKAATKRMMRMFTSVGTFFQRSKTEGKIRYKMTERARRGIFMFM